MRCGVSVSRSNFSKQNHSSRARTWRQNGDKIAPFFREEIEKLHRNARHRAGRFSQPRLPHYASYRPGRERMKNTEFGEQIRGRREFVRSDASKVNFVFGGAEF